MDVVGIKHYWPPNLLTKESEAARFSCQSVHKACQQRWRSGQILMAEFITAQCLGSLLKAMLQQSITDTDSWSQHQTSSLYHSLYSPLRTSRSSLLVSCHFFCTWLSVNLVYLCACGVYWWEEQGASVPTVDIWAWCLQFMTVVYINNGYGQNNSPIRYSFHIKGSTLDPFLDLLFFILDSSGTASRFSLS